jgi:hypothetical protein
MWSRILRSLALAGASLVACGCSRELDAIDIPWAGAATTTPTSAPRAASRERPAADIDCDDALPSLTPEEAARPPFSSVPLEKSSPRSGPPPRYTVLADVDLSDTVAAKISRIDELYARRTGKHVTVTSGTRDAARQAKAMYKMLRLGGDVMRLYRNKEAVREIKQAYDGARGAGRSPDEVVTAMYDVIQRQIARGVYISAHLRAGAVDVRNRDMSAAERKAFVAAASEAGGVALLDEATPPHFHLQVD